MHLPEHVSVSDVSRVSASDGKSGDSYIGSAVWNTALAGPRGPLGEEYEVRWIRSPGDVAHRTAGNPSLWWNGQPLESLVPPLTSEADK